MTIEPICGIVIDSEDGSESHVWRIEGLWVSAQHLPVEMLAPESLTHFLDPPQSSWYDGDEPTVWDFMEHAKRIYEADLSYPIIISAEGHLMDGRHRLAKAVLLGLPEIAVVRFVRNPEPDWRLPKKPGCPAETLWSK
jgi:hypothetical protein